MDGRNSSSSGGTIDLKNQNFFYELALFFIKVEKKTSSAGSFKKFQKNTFTTQKLPNTNNDDDNDNDDETDFIDYFTATRYTFCCSAEQQQQQQQQRQ